MYVEWAKEKCPAIAYRTLRVLRNLRSKSVNSFAGHPVDNNLYQETCRTSAMFTFFLF